METGRTPKLPGRVAEISLIIIALAMAAWYAWPHVISGESERNDYLVVHGAETICVALDRYSEKHGGAYPAPEQINGLTPEEAAAKKMEPDILLQQNYINAYPVNPFSGKNEMPMKKVPMGQGAPGDFSYERDPEKTYIYHLVAYGENGIVYDHEPEIY